MSYKMLLIYPLTQQDGFSLELRGEDDTNGRCNSSEITAANAARYPVITTKPIYPDYSSSFD